jgi:hypothetical protein
VRDRHASVAAKREEIDLYSGSRLNGLRVGLTGDSPETGHPVARTPSGEQASHLVPSKPTIAFRCYQGSSQLTVIEHRRQVEERPLYGRNSNPVLHRDLGKGQPLDLPDQSPMPTPASRHPRNFDRVTRAAQIPMMSGAAVRQRGAVSTRENRRRPPVAEIHPPVTHCIDAAMDRDQETRAATFLNQPLPDPQLSELAPGHHAVLGLGQLTNETSRLLANRTSLPILNTLSISEMDNVWGG